MSNSLMFMVLHMNRNLVNYSKDLMRICRECKQPAVELDFTFSLNKCQSMELYCTFCSLNFLVTPSEVTLITSSKMQEKQQLLAEETQDISKNSPINNDSGGNSSISSNDAGDEERPTTSLHHSDAGCQNLNEYFDEVTCNKSDPIALSKYATPICSEVSAEPQEFLNCASTSKPSDVILNKMAEELTHDISPPSILPSTDWNSNGNDKMEASTSNGLVADTPTSQPDPVPVLKIKCELPNSSIQYATISKLQRMKRKLEKQLKNVEKNEKSKKKKSPKKFIKTESLDLIPVPEPEEELLGFIPPPEEESSGLIPISDAEEESTANGDIPKVPSTPTCSMEPSTSFITLKMENLSNKDTETPSPAFRISDSNMNTLSHGPQYPQNVSVSGQKVSEGASEDMANTWEYLDKALKIHDLFSAIKKEEPIDDNPSLSKVSRVHVIEELPAKTPEEIQLELKLQRVQQELKSLEHSRAAREKTSSSRKTTASKRSTERTPSLVHHESAAREKTSSSRKTTASKASTSTERTPSLVHHESAARDKTSSSRRTTASKVSTSAERTPSLVHHESAAREKTSSSRRTTASKASTSAERTPSMKNVKNNSRDKIHGDPTIEKNRRRVYLKDSKTSSKPKASSFEDESAIDKIVDEARELQQQQAEIEKNTEYLSDCSEEKNEVTEVWFDVISPTKKRKIITYDLDDKPSCSDAPPAIANIWNTSSLPNGKVPDSAPSDERSAKKKITFDLPKDPPDREITITPSREIEEGPLNCSVSRTISSKEKSRNDETHKRGRILPPEPLRPTFVKDNRRMCRHAEFDYRGIIGGVCKCQLIRFFDKKHYASESFRRTNIALIVANKRLSLVASYKVWEERYLQRQENEFRSVECNRAFGHNYRSPHDAPRFAQEDPQSMELLITPSTGHHREVVTRPEFTLPHQCPGDREVIFKPEITLHRSSRRIVFDM